MARMDRTSMFEANQQLKNYLTVLLQHHKNSGFILNFWRESAITFSEPTLGASYYFVSLYPGILGFFTSFSIINTLIKSVLFSQN